MKSAKSATKATEDDAATHSDNISTTTRKRFVSKSDTEDKNSTSSSRDNNESFSGDPFMLDIPRRVSFGKPGAPNQQLLIFVGLIVVLFYVALQMGNMFQIDHSKEYHHLTTSKPKQSQERRERKRSSMQDMIEAAVKEFPHMFGISIVGTNDSDNAPCDIYVSDSSIPETGLGWFAGKNYSAGEVIRREHYNFLSGHPGFGSPSTSETTSNDGEGIVPLRFFLKPHSMLSNVRLDKDRSPSLRSQDHPPEGWTVSVLKAARDIREGEEFFLSWEDHPFAPSKVRHDDTNNSDLAFDYGFQKNLPTSEHFERADELIREARIQYFGAINYTKLELDKTKEKEPVVHRSGNARWMQARQKQTKRAHKSKQLYTSESAKNIENGLKLWQRAVESYDPLVAKLLPTKVRTLAMYHRRAEADASLVSSSSQLGSLRNQTVGSLANTAHCVSAFEWQLVSLPTSTEDKETDDSEDSSQSTIEKNCDDSLAPEVLSQATPYTQAEQSCSSRTSYRQIVTRKRGFSKGETVGIIPVLVLQHTQAQDTSVVAISDIGTCRSFKFASSLSELMACPLGGIYERTPDPDIANVEYRWTNSTMNKISVEVKSQITLPLSSSMLLSGKEVQHQVENYLEKDPLSMTWDIVARRELNQNETLVLYQPKGSMLFEISTEDTDL